MVPLIVCGIILTGSALGLWGCSGKKEEGTADDTYEAKGSPKPIDATAPKDTRVSDDTAVPIDVPAAKDLYVPPDAQAPEDVRQDETPTVIPDIYDAGDQFIAEEGVCGETQTADAPPAKKRYLAVAMSDYTKGAVALIGDGPPKTIAGSDAVGSDIALRGFGPTLAVINRYGGDKVQLFGAGPEFSLLHTFLTGAGSNPQDALLFGGTTLSAGLDDRRCIRLIIL